MAQKWHEKASVQATIVNALIGVLPATAIAAVAIYYQIQLGDDQIALTKQIANQQAVNDSADTRRSDQKYSNDSLQAVKQLEFTKSAVEQQNEKYYNDSMLAVKQMDLNKLQFELAKLKRNDDIKLNARLEQISKNNLAVSEGQYSIQKIERAAKSVSDIVEFGKVQQIMGDINRTLQNTYVANYIGPNCWSRKIISLLGSNLNNPALQENEPLLNKWLAVMEKIEEQQNNLSIRIFYENIKGDSAFIVNTLDKKIGINTVAQDELVQPLNRAGNLFGSSFNYYRNELIRRTENYRNLVNSMR
ncbi:hypothetical protein IC229_05970 [Spirosoma sp. BT702]|uniref:Uncharacterized protein n=1 Tax=Spirosoma profusum TaxID=2771354 RepID=A0A926XYI4_9BACT|nr:hypothetical protein [Spirosoma profusum]MBD2700173.1 hypothetical protein [Spirosoma profusum]